VIEFTVYGRPQPQGSSRAFTPKGWKRPVITSDNPKLKSWRQEASIAALTAMRGKEMLVRPTPVFLEATFYFARPASLSKKRILPTVKPDCDKLARGLFDSITGIVFEDDSQVVELLAKKGYGLPERTEVKVREVDGG
jgi:Holliday junction resolvase RusA-like endonuclease